MRGRGESHRGHRPSRGGYSESSSRGEAIGYRNNNYQSPPQSQIGVEPITRISRNSLFQQEPGTPGMVDYTRPPLLPSPYPPPHFLGPPGNLRTIPFSPLSPESVALSNSYFQPIREQILGVNRQRQHHPSPDSVSSGINLGQSPQSAVTMDQFQTPEKLLQAFRSMECSCCQQHFGFQSRTNKDLMFCSSSCLGKEKLLTPPPENEMAKSISQNGLAHVQSLQNMRLSEPPQLQPSQDARSVATVQNVKVSSADPGQSLPTPLAYVDKTNKSRPSQSRPTEDTVDKKGFSSNRSDTKPDQGQVTRQKAEGRGVPSGSSQGGPINPFLHPDHGPSNVPRERDAPGRNPEQVKVTKQPARPVPEPKPQFNPDPPKGSDEYNELLKAATTPTIDQSPFHPPPKVEKMNPPKKYPAVTIVENPKLSLMNKKLKWAEIEMNKGHVLERTQVNSACDFYIQTFQATNMANVLVNEINDYMAARRTPLRNFEIGTLCLAPFENVYYRGEIVAVDEKSVPPSYTIYFCDYGNEDVVKSGVLFELPDELAVLPRCAIQCRWDMAECKELAQEQVDSIFADETNPMFPHTKITEGQYLVKIMSMVPKSEIIIHRKQDLDKRAEVENNIAKAKAPAGRGRSLVDSLATQLPQPPVVKKKVYTINNTQYSPHLVSGSDVRIAFSWSMVRYLLASGADENTSLNIQKTISYGIQHNQYEPVTDTPKIGDILLGPYEGDYYRGQVIKISGDSITLEFVDFGDLATVKLSDLKLPNDALMKEPLYGVNVVLAGVEDVPGMTPSEDMSPMFEREMNVVFTDGVTRNNGLVQLWISEGQSLNDVVNDVITAEKRKHK